MPIHDQSYRRYQGDRLRPGGAWGVIVAAGLRGLFARKLFLALLLLAWLPFLVRVVQLYVAVSLPQASMLAATPGMFRDFLDQQGTFLFFVTVFVGSGLIAGDRRANALQLYLSRPLSRVEYVAGKLGILMFCQLLVTFVPALLLLGVQITLAGSLEFARSHLFLVPAITLQSFVQVVTAALTMLALSALSKSSRFVGILYAGLVVFSDALFHVMRVASGGTSWAWLSVPANVAQVGDVIFRQAARHEMPWVVSVVVLAGLVLVSLSILERRVRGVEVVT